MDWVRSNGKKQGYFVYHPQHSCRKGRHPKISAREKFKPNGNNTVQTIPSEASSSLPNRPCVLVRFLSQRINQFESASAGTPDNRGMG
jgi:hypothetical protein